jgi:hypothetical protein
VILFTVNLTFIFYSDDTVHTSDAHFNEDIVVRLITENTRSVEPIFAESGLRIFPVLVRARGPFLTSPLGANFDPQGRSCPPGVDLSLRGEVILWG